MTEAPLPVVRLRTVSPVTPEDIVDRHFEALIERTQVGSEYGRYFRPVLSGAAHLHMAAAVREAYELGRLHVVEERRMR